MPAATYNEITKECWDFIKRLGLVADKDKEKNKHKYYAFIDF